MELVDRYIHAVTARLPEAQREDIKRELQSLIEDMLEERSPESPRPSKTRKACCRSSAIRASWPRNTAATSVI